MTELLLLMAPSPGGGGNSTMGALTSIIPIILIFVVFYFFMIRPQKKKQDEKEKAIAALVKGDKVVTIGGAHGVIDGIDDKTVTVRLTPAGLLVKFDKSAISTITKASE